MVYLPQTSQCRKYTFSQSWVKQTVLCMVMHGNAWFHWFHTQEETPLSPVSVSAFYSWKATRIAGFNCK